MSDFKRGVGHTGIIIIIIIVILILITVIVVIRLAPGSRPRGHSGGSNHVAFFHPDILNPLGGGLGGGGRHGGGGLGVSVCKSRWSRLRINKIKSKAFQTSSEQPQLPISLYNNPTPSRITLTYKVSTDETVVSLRVLLVMQSCPTGVTDCVNHKKNARPEKNPTLTTQGKTGRKTDRQTERKKKETKKDRKFQTAWVSKGSRSRRRRSSSCICTDTPH